MAWQFPKLTRRTFLKSTALGTAGVAALRPTTSSALFGFGGDSEQPLTESVSYTVCNFCSSLCNVEVTSRGEGEHKRITKLDGNPNSTLNRGKLCARGQSGLYQTYDTDRLKTPLIRVEGSKRGEMKFRAASWDEAWEYIASKSKSAKIQPWEWSIVGGWTSCVFYMNWSVPFSMANEVPNLVASPMQHCVTAGHFGTDMVTGNFNVHDEILPDYDNARYILFISNNGSIGAVSTPRAVRFATGKKRGARVVALDPRQSETAAKADEWIPIRPGTDLDFVLAMMREMMVEGYYDDEFLRHHTNLPFLAYRDEQGEWQLYRDDEGHPYAVDEQGELHSLPASANSNQLDAEGQRIHVALNAPEDLEQDGHKLVTVFQAQLQDIDFCTPQWAAKTTGIEAATIRRVAKEFGTIRPAVVDPGWMGARYGNTLMLRRVQAMLQTLVGGIDREGGWIMGSEYRHKVQHMYEAQQHGEPLHPVAELAGLPFFNMVGEAVAKGENFSHGKPAWAWAYAEQQRQAGKEWVMLPAMADYGLKQAVEGKLQYKGEPYLARALFINASNPARHYYPDSHWKTLMSHENMELVVVADVLPSDTTAYADVILPNSTYLERDEPAVYGNGVNHDLALTTRLAAIEPLYDTRESADILFDLTKAIGGSQDRLIQTVEQLSGIPAAPVKERLAQMRAEGHANPFSLAYREVVLDGMAQKLGVSREHLEKTLVEQGVYKITDKAELLAQHSMPHHMPVPTASGRIEFFSSLLEDLRAKGGKSKHFSVLAAHIPANCRADKTMDEPLGTDEFYFTFGKAPTVSHGSTNANNPILSAINRFKEDIYTGIWIHPQRAEKLGIASGDSIRLSNVVSDQQQASGRAYLTRMVQPDTLFMYSAFGTENPALTRAAGFGTSTTKLIPYQVDPLVAGFRSQEFTLRVAKA